MEKNQKLTEAKNRSKLSTQVRLNFLTEGIVKSGWTRYDCVKYAEENWGLANRQAQRYFYSALHNLVPDDPEKYREALIQRNMEVLENMLKSALERNNLKVANDIIKTINSILGVGGKQVEIEDKNSNSVIKISFGD